MILDLIKIFLGFAISLSSILVNRIYLDSNDDYSRIMDFQLLGLLIILLLLIASLFKRALFKRSILFLFLLIISSGLFFGAKSYQFYARQAFIKEYSEMTCEEHLMRFEKDKERGKFIYVSYGFFPNYGLEKKFMDKYGLEVVVTGGGCIGNDAADCFNEVLLEYMEELE